MKRRRKKAVSPVISTVLLIAIVLVLAVIIFLWARGWSSEIIEKEIGGVKKTVEKYCPEVNFQASLTSDGALSLINKGNIPIYKLRIKKENPGTSESDDVQVDLSRGGTNSTKLSSISEYEKVILIPILLGKSGKKNMEFPCDENYAVECIKEEDLTFTC